jgi:hypothetical protein
VCGQWLLRLASLVACVHALLMPKAPLRRSAVLQSCARAEDDVTQLGPSTGMQMHHVAYGSGNVIALHHAFAHGGEPMRGFFGSLPFDAHSVYIGPARLKMCSAPNCYLADSEDGQTRRQLALTDISCGQSLTLPPPSFGIATDNDVLIARALACSENDPRYEDGVREAGSKGRGVFARRNFVMGEVVESWPCFIVADSDVPRSFKDYVKTSPKLGTSLVVLGTGMLHNHGIGSKANLMWSVPSDPDLLATGEGTLQFFARRDVAEGEELCENYGDTYWKSRGVTPS